MIERILNHSAGGLGDLAAIYNRYRYEAEVRAALEGWARLVESIVSPGVDSDVVVGMGRRR